MEALYQQLNKKDFYCEHNFSKNVVFALILSQLIKLNNFYEILIWKANWKTKLVFLRLLFFLFDSRADTPEQKWRLSFRKVSNKKLFYFL